MDEPAPPRPRRGEELVQATREDLELYSVQDLDERIEVLEGEIARVREAIGRKRAGRSAADAVFSLGRSA